MFQFSTSHTAKETAGEPLSTQAKILDTVRFILTVFVLWLLIRVFITQPFLVDGASMSPNLETGHYLLIDKVSYHFKEPARGDVVVFKFPGDTSKYFIKRIIGLPGERVIVRGTNTTITKTDGKTIHIAEPFVALLSETDSKDITLAKDEYFVMGDNRAKSYDSRFWGALPKEDITGKAFLRLFPFTSIGFSPAGIQEFHLSTLEEDTTQ